jgi:hypothetical protein
MANRARVMVRPTSTICIPVGATPQPGSVSIAKILIVAGLANSSGVLNDNIESFRLVGGEFRAASSNTTAANASVTSVRFEDGQTFELMDPFHSVKLKISNRNPLGFWKSDTSGNAFTIEGLADCVSFTIAVRYRQVSFQ